jgi:Ca-activated chloride channel family protein
MAEKPGYYTLLGLPKDATPDEIRRAYRQAARRLHPDANTEAGETELFIGIQEAYEVLADEIKRAAYDDSLPHEPEFNPPINLNLVYSRSTLPRLSEPQMIYVLVELIAQPDPDSILGAPLNVCLVLDCSTSMEGELLDTVKASAIELVRQLRPQDILSIVVFSDRAEILLPAGNRLERSVIETNIRMLQTSGGTEIYKGLEAGYNEVRRNRSSKHLNHIILITDGRTYGDEAQCMSLVDQASQEGVGISGLGIGDKWNDVFLDNLAKQTGGNSMYVSKPKAIRQFLKEKFIGLGQSFGENVVYDFDTGPGVQLRYAFRMQPETSPLDLKAPLHLGSVPRDVSLNILLEFMIKPVPPDVNSISIAKGRLILDIPSKISPKFTVRLNLDRPTSKDPDPFPPPQEIVQAMSRLTLYRMQERARQDVAEGKIKEATRRLQNIATHLLSQGNHELALAILSEADHIQQNLAFSEEGEKRIKYGTRGLLLPVVVKEKTE